MTRERLQGPGQDGTPSAMDATRRTLDTWQPLYRETLSVEDAREIRRNMIGFFRLLLEADARQRAERSA